MASFISKLKIYRFFDDFVVIYPLYTLMFQAAGLTTSSISVLLLVWSITSFVLEIPSGILADKYDRKTILILGQLIRIIGYAFWLLMPTQVGFLIGFVFWGIKSAMTSGTLDAYLYDGLKDIGKKTEYSKILGSLHSLSFIAILLASALSSLIYAHGYAFVMVISILSLVISTLALFVTTSSKSNRSTGEAKYADIARQGINALQQNYAVISPLLISAIFTGAMAIDEYLALYSSQLKVPNYFIGYLFAFYSLIQAVGSWLAHKFDSNQSIYLALFFLNLGLLLLGLLDNMLGILVFVLLAIISSVGQILSNHAIQRQVPSEIRATISSVSGFMAEVIALSIYLIFWSIKSNNLNQGFLIFGVLILLISVLSVMLPRKNKVMLEN